ncbi:hypothetical protein QDR63_18835 [Acinetobacter baumannii]|uniref:hypothetical protein n=1 Tax=Acinetobacter baumannii TaxID=470 RepID=UPI002447CCB3|nr:hypothetical protein [Acinetobacter baumannii]MDH2528316.1 hypothetical protein [Acinetobacter baumannii]
MASYSNECIQNAQSWIDEIDDIDAFLDQLIEVNENCTSAPSLDAFCSSFALDTTENLISSAIESTLLSELDTISVECLSNMSKMSIPKDLSKVLIPLSMEIDKDDYRLNLSEFAYDSLETTMIGNFKTQEVSYQYQIAA